MLKRANAPNKTCFEKVLLSQEGEQKKEKEVAGGKTQEKKFAISLSR